MAESKDPRSPKMKNVVKMICEKFDEDKILPRKGQGGKTFHYVKAQEYIVKLNDVFGVAWSSEIISHWLANNQICMWVRISYPNPDNPDQIFFKDGVDAHPLSQDVGNSFKAAYLKAFRKAAAQIGAGLHLWGIDVDEDESVPAGPPVTVVNPGAHNMPPVPGAYPAPAPPVTIPRLPPVPQPVAVPTGAAPPPVAPGFNQPPPPPPQFMNSGATAGPPVPGAGPILPPPPVPVGNPAAVDTTNAAGITRGPDTPAVASVGIPSSGRPAGGIEDFQVNGILGAAVTRGVEPLHLVASVLGETGITDIQQLTAEQAQRVMDASRQMPPQ
jgi:hypothetical protein